jgi:glycosyltransferase involved in cell wall biosynthesis
MKISILIPIYNECLTLPMVVQRVVDAKLPNGWEKEIIIVDDGSTDGTTELLRQYKDSPLILVHHSPVNFGKGAAIRIGLAKATGEIILVQDGDLEYDPNDYIKVLQPLADGNADVVFGSRFLQEFKGMKLANWVANKILTLTANVLYGSHLTDEATAYKAFKADVLRSIQLKSYRFEFCPEVTAKVLRAGYKIHEVPISYNPRGILEGKKIRWHDGVEAMWTLIRYRIAPVSSFTGTPQVKPSGVAKVTASEGSRLD